MKKLIAKMEALQAEVKDLTAKAKSEKDEAKGKVLKDMADGKIAEFEECEAEVKQATSEAKMNATLAEAKRLDEPARKFNTDPKEHPGKKDPEGKRSPDVDTRQSWRRDLEAKRDIFFKGFHGGGLNALEGEEAKNFAPSKMEKFCNDSLVAPMRSPMILPPHVFHAITANLISDGKGGVLRDAQGKVMLSTDTTGGVTDSGSGDTIDPNFIASLITRPLFMPTIKDRVTRAPASNGRYIFPKLDYTQGTFAGVSHTWQSTEGAAKTETDATFTQLTDDTSELSSIIKTSLINLQRSALGLESILIDLLRAAWSYEISRVILYGTGSDQPLGIRADGGLLSQDRIIADEVHYQDYTNLIYALSMGFRLGASFIMDDKVEKFSVQELDEDGRPLFTASVADGPADRIAKYPYETHEYGASESTPATLGDDADVIFGNLAQYFLGVEQEIAIETSDHVEFIEGRRVIRAMSFVGGKLSNASSFVQLDEDTIA